MQPSGHLVAVVGNSAAGMRTAEYTGRLAAALRAPVTVALILRPPLALALAAHAVVAHYPLDDVEIDVMLHLSRVFDGLGVPWRLEPVTGDLSATVAHLANKDRARYVVVGRAWPGWPRYTPRIVRTLRRRYGLPVLIVPTSGDEQAREMVA